MNTPSPSKRDYCEAAELGYNIKYTGEYVALRRRALSRGITQALGERRAAARKGKSFTNRTYHTTGTPQVFMETFLSNPDAASQLLRRRITMMHNILDDVNDARAALRAEVGYAQASKFLVECGLFE